MYGSSAGSSGTALYGHQIGSRGKGVYAYQVGSQGTGVHAYQLEDFGLDRQELDAQFKAYRDHYGVPIES